MSGAEDCSAASKSSSEAGLRQLTLAGWWSGGITFLIVLSPIVLGTGVAVLALAARAISQLAHGEPVELPTPANIKLYGLGSYAVGSWIAVTLAWLWSKRSGVLRETFLFRRMTLPALASSLAGFVVVTFCVLIATRWLTHLTGHHTQDVRIDFSDFYSVMIVSFLFVLTTPVSEEILYRGLLVAWLRRLGWKDFSILLVGSLTFAANHVIPLGFVWGMAMVLLGAVLFSLRLRYESLSPAWLAHALFNAQLVLSSPLIAWFEQALKT